MIIHRIADPMDPWAPEWIRVYERAFPERERMQAAHYWQTLQRAARREAEPPHMLAMLLDGALAGIGHWAPAADDCAWLWYLAAARPGGGLGKQLFDAIIADVRTCSPETRLLLFEVELPDEPSTHSADVAARRMGWYRKLGAWLLAPLDAYEYYTSAGEWQPKTRMALMAYPLADAGRDPQAALQMLIHACGDALKVHAPVRLE